MYTVVIGCVTISRITGACFYINLLFGVIMESATLAVEARNNRKEKVNL